MSQTFSWSLKLAQDVERKIESVSVHPRFDKTGANFNVAVLKIKPVEISSTTLRPGTNIIKLFWQQLIPSQAMIQIQVARVVGGLIKV